MAEVISMAEFRAGKYVAEKPEPVIKAQDGITRLTPQGDQFDYGFLMKMAICGLIMTVLKDVEKSGMPKNSSLLITFNTADPDVTMSKQLREKWPTALTIGLDAWWENLSVDDLGFVVTLNFGDVRETMSVPYSAITSFQDPNAMFGLGLQKSASQDTPQPPSPRLA